MRAKLLLAVLPVLLLAGLAGRAESRSSAALATVSRVADGDTIELRGGARVRLLQIDSPEVGMDECYSRASAKELRRLLPVGSSVELQSDPRLDKVDRYGRLLRYVFRGTTNVNVALVRRGAATVWFYSGVQGRHAGQLLYAARLARSERRGLWGACDTS